MGISVEADRRRKSLRIFEATDAAAAIAMARDFQRSGEYDLFRGQTQRWPVVPTLMRLDEAAHDNAMRCLQMFFNWALSTQSVSSMVEADLANLMAVAQHYQLPTTLVDFSTDPAIAGFFATDTETKVSGESCIYCLKRAHVESQMQALAKAELERGVAQDELQIPTLIEVDVANLWRLQAQAGLFLHVPYTQAELQDGRLERWFSMACIVFPAGGSVSDPPRNRVYPDRKSPLEVLLDEFFQRKELDDARKLFEADGYTIIDGDTRLDPDTVGFFKPEVAAVLKLIDQGRQLDIFTNNQPPQRHQSWNVDSIGPWVEGKSERFGSKKELEAQLSFRRLDDLEDLDDHCIDRFRKYLTGHRSAREHVVRWSLVDEKTKKLLKLAKWIDFAWDGLRLLPFEDDALAIALGRTMAAFLWDSKRGSSSGDFVNEYFADRIVVELITDTKGESLAQVTELGLKYALRPDLERLLKPEWRYLAAELSLLLRVFGAPDYLTIFDRWHRLFAVEVFPMQVVLAAAEDRDWLVFNPLDVRRLQPH